MRMYVVSTPKPPPQPQSQPNQQAREAVAERRTLEMELLRLIETTERGRKATRGQHAAILQIIGALERGFQVCTFIGVNVCFGGLIHERVRKALTY